MIKACCTRVDTAFLMLQVPASGLTCIFVSTLADVSYPIVHRILEARRQMVFIVVGGVNLVICLLSFLVPYFPSYLLPVFFSIKLPLRHLKHGVPRACPTSLI
jgi:multisubunit Na+/H+ antiporter MnhB subunit